MVSRPPPEPQPGAPAAGLASEHARRFGARAVAPADRTRLVGQVFSSVARRYDLMNDLMSLGLHRAWKDWFVSRVRPRPGERILDLAGGTGDIAFRLARRGAAVTVADINPDMLAVGEARARRRGLARLAFTVANAEAMPFAANSFDAVTIAFGIRNVTGIEAALSEIRRVLAWGGRFFCLEFSQTDWPGFAQLYDLYARKVVPRLGALVARDRESYSYLVESIRRFPDVEAFAAMVRAAGFSRVSVTPILGGAVAIHAGWKI